MIGSNLSRQIKVNGFSRAISRKCSSSQLASPPVAQLVGQRPQKITRVARRSNLSPLASSHDEFTLTETIETASINTEGLATARHLSSNTQIKLKTDQTPPANLLENEDSGVAENKLRDKTKKCSEIEEKSSQSMQKVATLVLPSRKSKVAAEEDIGDGVRESDDDHEELLAAVNAAVNSKFEYNQMSIDDQILLELSEIGLHPEPVPDLTQSEEEDIMEGISNLEEMLHKQACWGPSATGSKSMNKNMKHATLAFVKRTLARCQKFEKTGTSCFNEPVFRDIFLSMSSHNIAKENVDIASNGEASKRLTSSQHSESTIAGLAEPSDASLPSGSKSKELAGGSVKDLPLPPDNAGVQELCNLQLPELDVGDFGGQGQDIGSWLNIDDDDVLQDHDFMGLEIPMDDLSEVNMMMDKASLLGKVIEQVKDLKRKAVDISKGFTIPSETNEVTVESKGGFRADMISLGGRVRNVFILCKKDSQQGGVCMTSLEDSIKEVLARIASSDVVSGKRQRLMQSQYSNISF
ncbi:hypothetical protein J5N97_005999 [Dioscorea zingiberensis]|uniref:Uncharacterized protein n=1 Tax=Dioscorea zingiberensis TaxID=325984 RepID=A0A9D5D9E9_9LILI|nr:hypothetical protein J5N97_005999 [Dioscorea zingiberensis]